MYLLYHKVFYLSTIFLIFFVSMAPMLTTFYLF